MLYPIMRWHTDQLAYFLGQLDAVSESDGRTLLDNSAVLWGTDTPNGISHNYTRTDAGIMLFGGAGGGIKTNQDVTISGRFQVDLLATISRAMGADSSAYENRVNYSAPIAQLL